MNDFNLDKYIYIVNEEIKKRGMENYIPLYPMLRIVDDKLYIAVMLTDKKENVWITNSNVKAEYWVLIDPITEKIIEFNNTNEKDFVLGNLIEKAATESTRKEVSKYIVKKTIEYKDYLLNDIKNDQLPIQKKLSDSLNNEFEIDGTKVNINDYLISLLEQDIKKKIDDLVDVLVQSKYSSINYYYNQLINLIITEYKNNGKIDKDKIKLCIEVMNNYYDGVIAIDNMFNIF